LFASEPTLVLVVFETVNDISFAGVLPPKCVPDIETWSPIEYLWPPDLNTNEVDIASPVNES